VTCRDEHPRPEEAAGAARRPIAPADRSEAVADELWDRLRALADRVARYEEADAVGELDEEGRAKLDALRVRAARAADRAQLADELADLVAEARAARRRTQFP
jgi:regulator of sigma D